MVLTGHFFLVESVLWSICSRLLELPAQARIPLLYIPVSPAWQPSRPPTAEAWLPGQDTGWASLVQAPGCFCLHREPLVHLGGRCSCQSVRSCWPADTVRERVEKQRVVWSHSDITFCAIWIESLSPRSAGFLCHRGQQTCLPNAGPCT